MGVERITSDKEIDSMLEKAIERRNRALIRTVRYTAEESVAIAKDGNKAGAKNFKDRTGNLRSSIGSIVTRDGKTVETAGLKEAVEGPEGNGELGRKTGADRIKNIAKRFNQGITMVLCAGMDYAFYVKKYGYDVIDSAWLNFKFNLNDRLRKQGFLR